MRTGLYRCVLIGFVLALMAACSGPATQAPSTAPEASAKAPEAPQPAVPRRSVADDVRELLLAAEAAMAADKLTTPIHDNAFDRFQAVLLLDPGNTQARSGLQQVFARYVGMIRSALARHDPGRAMAMLERARMVQHDHPALDDLDTQVAALREKLDQQDLSADSGDGREFILDSANLDRKDQRLVQRLKELAQQVKASDETLLIIARNDSEGRWIYQRMSEGVPDYRLRGDIQLGRTPRILILPPID